MKNKQPIPNNDLNDSDRILEQPFFQIKSLFLHLSPFDVRCSMFIFLVIPPQSIRRKNNSAPLAFPLESKDLCEGKAAISGMVLGVIVEAKGKRNLDTRQ